MGDSSFPISTDNLTKDFGDTHALRQFTLNLEQGEVFGLLGPNGAGKTTMIRLVLGLLRATAGTATIFGKSAWGDVREVHRDIAYVPGDFRVWPQLTGHEMLALLSSTRPSTDLAYQDELVKRFAFEPDKRGRSYSKGNRQKVILISALASRAKLLILDEPTSGLDPLMEEVFQDCIAEAKRNGQTVLLSSHILSEVEATCDRVGILRTGELVECGTLAQLSHLHANTYNIGWSGASSPKLDDLVGVSELLLMDHHATFRFAGDTSALLSRLSVASITQLESRQPSLEELFLTLYQGDQSGNDIS